MLSLSGAALVPAALNNRNIEKVPGNIPELPARTLGKTGIKTPLLSMGAANASATGFVKTAYEGGVKLFFSANYYGEGNNEILVGNALRDMPRDSFIIGTASVPDGIDMRTGLLPKSFTTDSYMKKTEESLKRFGLDYIDILLFPFAGKKETVLHDAVLETFEKVKKQGKARFVGIASHGDTEEALNAAVESGIYDVAMISYNFKIQNLDALNAAISSAAKAGIGIVAMKASAGASRDKSSTPINVNAAYKWALQNEHISSVVSGMTSIEELNKNLAMIQNIKLSDQEKKDLQLASALSPEGLYCQQCKQCIPQCPHNLDIPTIMRSYMYAYGYKNTSQAWHTLAGTEITSHACKDCGTCKVKCPSGFDVMGKITDIARLGDVPKDFIHS